MISLGTKSLAFPVDTFILHINNLHLPLRTISNNKKVKVIFGDDELNIEPAIARILKESGCDVLNGDQVHLAGHVLTDKFMAVDDCVTFKNWARHYGYTDQHLDDVLMKAHRLFILYLASKEEVMPELIASVVERWDIYNNPVESRREEIRILADFWLKNPDIFKRWVLWYKSRTYDPGGAPDLFAWDRAKNEWAWFEVKSIGDSIRGNQWEWIWGFCENVAQDVGIVRVLPK